MPDDDILIIATHNPEFIPNTEGINISTDENIYEREEIPFSPLNTPVLNLTNDSGALVYDAKNNAKNKLGEGTASTTAALWLNGSKLPDDDVSYTWELCDCHQQEDCSDTTATGNTVNIKYLDANEAEAICTATYQGENYIKTFALAKQIAGKNSTAYWLNSSTPIHTGHNQMQSIVVTAMKKEGTDPETQDTEAKLFYKYAGEAD